MTTKPLTARALGRATLERQCLLRRAPMTAEQAVTHLAGLQAQEVRPPYVALVARLTDFTPAHLCEAIESRRLARTVTLRSTIHLHTADDLRILHPLTRPARERELRQFRAGLTGVDLDRLAALARAYVEQEPRTPKQIRELLLGHWRHAEPRALSVAARCLLPLVQVTPRGLWRRSGGVRLTTAGRWFGDETVCPPVPDPASAPGPASAPDPAAVLDTAVLRYLGAFGPASVKDFQQWAGITRTKDAFERLRPRLTTFRAPEGVELFDLPDAPRPDEDTPAPPRLLAEYDNVLLSHADRTRVVRAVDRGRNWQTNKVYPTFLVDGMLAGLWALDESGDTGDAGHHGDRGRDRGRGRKYGATLTLEPFADLTRAQRDELVHEAERTAAVLEAPGPVTVAFGTVRN
ncbi:winged helix DNA-binding domain-containing protein [Streptomyces beihaiensis]|uniref:Winged helix DNA-binding domain-containing protein n=1 Tax=Streptomyces beihaiensis TaxID=2984495 RepID=A0ABT3TV61_9ACTN|nr:winged helix DNA-binding domain-containing protein [Streptomyces beihaiensis]MCX3060926.1 winged helix DNA-binding domain-containing protein [Streptomyces beihaiensis]